MSGLPRRIRYQVTAAVEPPEVHMTTNHRLTTAALLAALGAGIVACNDSRGPLAPRLVVPTLLIEGPSRIAPGESAPFRAILQAPDASRRDITADAAWTSSNAGILEISPGGMVQGV